MDLLLVSRKPCMTQEIALESCLFFLPGPLSTPSSLLSAEEMLLHTNPWTASIRLPPPLSWVQPAGDQSRQGLHSPTLSQPSPSSTMAVLLY